MFHPPPPLGVRRLPPADLRAPPARTSFAPRIAPGDPSLRRILAGLRPTPAQPSQPPSTHAPLQQRAEQPGPVASTGDERPVRTVRHGRLVTATRRFPREELPPDPVRLLEAEDAPRGAWERGGSWSVFGGSALELGAGDEERGRFESIRRQVDAWAGRSGRPAAADGVPGPRLYGGFSFHPDPDASGPWAGFPAALFRVPAREVRAGPEEAWLVATRVADGEGADGDEAEAGARRELERLEERIRTLRDGGNGRAGSEPTHDSGARYDAGEQERWERGVEEALERIRGGDLEKVVLARALDVPAADAVDPAAAYRRLRDDDPRSSLFLVQPAPGTAFLGGSPELLGAARGRSFRATAVAGSVARGRTSEEDRALGRRLLESEKDRREQAIVAEEIRRCLSGRLRAVSVGDPRLLKLARIQHLESSVEGRFPEPGEAPRLLEVIADLHPTPAVCGRPRDGALAFLRGSERFERGWYAAPIGWLGPGGDGAFVPGLRSAVLHDGTWRLFAGAGIVEGSDPAAEWEETGVKFVPMLRALGVERGP